MRNGAGHTRGPNYELQTHFIIAETLQFGAKETYESPKKLSADVSRLLIALMNSLRQ